jgi:hypothetical protein
MAEIVNVQNTPILSRSGMTAGLRIAVVAARKPLIDAMSTTHMK